LIRIIVFSSNFVQNKISLSLFRAAESTFFFGSFVFEAFGGDICVDGLKKLAKTAYCVIFCGSFLVF